MRFAVRCWRVLGLLWFLLAGPTLSYAADGNRLAYLDQSDPFYVSRSFPKLVTPQWIGEPGVQAVVILSIDDMRGHEKWEEFLRPVLERLKKIDGRAPVSIMTCRVEPREPHLQTWLSEGVSLECHTYDHPCPLLQKGNLAAARTTYERTVDLMHAVPGSKAVAFRMPCCDSLNSTSPRFFAEIFNRRTAAGNFLTIDSSVSNLITANDPELPRELVLDANAQEIFRRYLPNKSFVTTIEDYPYPYVIGRLCWEFPMAAPSDWSAQKLRKPDNPQTVEDLKRAIDATVIKQGVFSFCFHPHKWIKNTQIIELIDHVSARYGNKVKFLTFREAQERLNYHLLAGQPLRRPDGGDNGVRLLDVNFDGFVDVVIGNDQKRETRLWSPKEQTWSTGDFPLALVTSKVAASAADLAKRKGILRIRAVDAATKPADRETPVDVGAQFGVLSADGFPSLLARSEGASGAWRFDGRRWVEDSHLLTGLEVDGNQLLTAREGRDLGVRLRDLDADGICELIIGNPRQHGVFGFESHKGWRKLGFDLPDASPLVDEEGRDAGLRFVDIDQDGYLDVLGSNDRRWGAHRFVSRESGWSHRLAGGAAGEAGAIPPLVRAGTNNGAWIHGRQLFVQNEDTDKLPDLVDRMPLDQLMKDVPYPGPKTPQASLAVTHVRPGFEVELVVCEPLVIDPIWIAWGPDGRMWVVEMGDYPRGLDGKGKRGGIVRCLEDADGDGRYDKSTVFLDDLGFPTGVAPWRDGILVTCAPDILYAEDTDGDGKADKREVLYHGFTQSNPQHRMNGLKWGMDGWLYGAHGDGVGGAIKLMKTGETVGANGRDFRIRPDEGLLDPQPGQTQFGRNCDDFGNWFGSTNSEPMFQFVLNDNYLRRNPHVPAANGRVHVSVQPGAAEVFPLSRTLARFNDLYAANRFTSANSAIVYRDDLFGPAFEGNSFVSEPVHNLVHREVMRADGLTFVSQRADDETDCEFLASADNWFRPTTIAVGPDGALWVADMYRQTIEHPEWIPQEIQKQVDLRAGSDLGRIYRVYPIGKRPRKIPRLDRMTTAELIAAIDSSSGWQRDMIQQMLLWRKDPAASEPLGRLAATAVHPAARVHALWTLELLGALGPTQIAAALADAHPGVRRHAVRLAEGHLAEAPQLGDGILKLADDADMQVQLQRAYTLGEWKDPRAGQALGQLARRFADNRFMVAGILSSVTAENLNAMVAALLDIEAGQQPPAELFEQLVALASKFDDEATLELALKRIAQPVDGKYSAWQLTALAGLLDALARRDSAWQKYDEEQQLTRIFQFARALVANDEAPEDERMQALRLLGRDDSQRASDIGLLVARLVPQSSGALQTATVEVLSTIDDERVPKALLAGWKSHSPALRSEILDAMLNRDPWVEVVLAAVERLEVPAADIDAARRQRLLRSGNEQIKQLTDKLFSGAIESDRAQVLARHEPVLSMEGDAVAGQAVFTKRCAACHRLRGAGHEVGPNLASLTDYSPKSLLTAMLDPNRAIEAKYLDYVAVTSAGLTYTGMLANETGNSVTLVGQEGKQQTILRTELEKLQTTGKSLMPEGLEKDLNEQDLANVIAYLRGSGAPRKRFPANHPHVIKPISDGTLQLYATGCEIYGPTLSMEYLYKNLARWQSENDRAVWTIDVPKPGRYGVLLNYSCLDSAAGNSWLLEAGNKNLSGKVAGTGSLDHYQQVPCGEIDLPAGEQQIVLRSAGPIKDRLFNLGGVLLKPAPAAK